MDKILPLFIQEFFNNKYIDEDEVERNFYDFGVEYFKNNPEDDFIVEFFAPLKDSVILYEPEIEYAPAISYKMASQKLLGKSPVKTKNKKNVIKKIANRSSKAYQFHIKYLKTENQKLYDNF